MLPALNRHKPETPHTRPVATPAKPRAPRRAASAESELAFRALADMFTELALCGFTIPPCLFDSSRDFALLAAARVNPRRDHTLPPTDPLKARLEFWPGEHMTITDALERLRSLRPRATRKT